MPRIHHRVAGALALVWALGPGAPASRGEDPVSPEAAGDAGHEEPSLPAVPLQNPVSRTDRYFFAAVREFERKNYRRASRMFKTLLEAKPFLLRAKVNLAISLYMSGDMKESKELCRQILESVPRNEKIRQLWKEIAPGEPIPSTRKYRDYLAVYDVPPGKTFTLEDYQVDDYYTLFYFYSSVERTSMTSLPKAEEITGNSRFLVLRKVDVNRPSIETGVDLESPVAQQFGIREVPHLVLLDPKGKSLISGTGTWRKILELKEREDFLEKTGAGDLELGGGDLFPVLELDGVETVVEIADYLSPGRMTIMDFYSIESPEYAAYVERLKKLVELRSDLRMVRVNLGMIEVAGKDPQPNWKSPNIKRYGLEDIPFLQIYDDAGKVLQSGGNARTQLDAWLGSK